MQTLPRPFVNDHTQKQMYF